MKILYYDCFSGISGDMNLGALIDLGVDSEYLVNELRKLKIDGYEVRISKQQRKGITGTRAEVILKGDEHHNHDHGHNHVETRLNPHHHHHGPEYVYAGPEPGHDHRDKYRNFRDIEKIILESELSEKVKNTSLEIFKLVARAEAKIHGIPPEEVHFHEVGAVDSIVDIVGAAVCIDYLKPDRIIASPVEMGSGFVNCAHGTFPVPAPATLEIMRGKPMKLGAVPFETATPTGTAILVVLADEFTETPAFTVTATGYGIGGRDTEIPNVLRVCLGETDESEASEKIVDAVMLECNIDDMNPERYAYVTERLFETGADDVFLQTIIMKKSRPAVLISVLCSPEKISAVEHVLFTETTTLGVRHHRIRKTVLDRRADTVDTPWGQVRIKKAYYRGKKLRTKPEYDDCAAIARKHGIDIEKVYEYVRQRIVSSDSADAS